MHERFTLLLTHAEAEAVFRVLLSAHRVMAKDVLLAETRRLIEPALDALADQALTLVPQPSTAAH